MLFYVFSLKLPYTVFSVAYKFHDFLFKYVLYLRFKFYLNKIKFKFSKNFNLKKNKKRFRYLKIKIKIFRYLLNQNVIKFRI